MNLRTRSHSILITFCFLQPLSLAACKLGNGAHPASTGKRLDIQTAVDAVVKAQSGDEEYAALTKLRKTGGFTVTFYDRQGNVMDAHSSSFNSAEVSKLSIEWANGGPVTVVVKDSKNLRVLLLPDI